MSPVALPCRNVARTPGSVAVIVRSVDTTPPEVNTFGMFLVALFCRRASRAPGSFADIVRSNDTIPILGLEINPDLRDAFRIPIKSLCADRTSVSSLSLLPPSSSLGVQLQVLRTHSRKRFRVQVWHHTSIFVGAAAPRRGTSKIECPDSEPRAPVIVGAAASSAPPPPNQIFDSEGAYELPRIQFPPRAPVIVGAAASSAASPPNQIFDSEVP
ncbi:hypothetical protein DFH06DRAFT_1323790 [Mycena polygramma]|nr:hypothetical protein DFH06DRAFT_1323790 [Mycena polygramma]